MCGKRATSSEYNEATATCAGNFDIGSTDHRVCQQSGTNAGRTPIFY